VPTFADKKEEDVVTKIENLRSFYAEEHGCFLNPSPGQVA
jgi:hypothetical protein